MEHVCGFVTRRMADPRQLQAWSPTAREMGQQWRMLFKLLRRVFLLACEAFRCPAASEDVAAGADVGAMPPGRPWLAWTAGCCCMRSRLERMCTQ